MTKKQVLFSLRQRVDIIREKADCERSRPSGMEGSSYYYYSGFINACDNVLEMLSDYE